MKKTVLLLSIFCSLIFGHKPAIAHGVHIDFTIQSPVVTVKAYFSKNSPMVHSGISIFAPGSDKPFQTGNTDHQGNFAFLPDKAGTWKVIADDGMGHKRTSEIIINESFFKVEEQQDTSDTHQHEQEHLTDAHESHHHHEHTHAEIPVTYKVIFGLSLIFGITGIFYGLKKRKS